MRELILVQGDEILNGNVSDCFQVSQWHRGILFYVNQGEKRPGGETGSPLFVQCVMRKRTGSNVPFALPVQLMAAKNLLRRTGNEIFFLYFKATSSVFLKAFLIFLAHNSITFCLLAHQLSVFVVSCSNLSEIRQCRMQEYPAYYDQIVFRFFFYEYSILLQSKFYIC